MSGKLRSRMFLSCAVALGLAGAGLWRSSAVRPEVPVAVQALRPGPENRVDDSWLKYDLPVADHVEGFGAPIDSQPATAEVFENTPPRPWGVAGESLSTNEDSWTKTGQIRELESSWQLHDQRRREANSQSQFFKKWLGPLLADSDGWGFYDPTDYPLRAPVPIKLPRAFGAGVRYRASF